MEIITTREFEDRYVRLPIIIQKRAEKQERLFCHNPFYPSLNTEKLEPKSKNVWSFRVDKSYRIIFRFVDSKTVLFLTIGRHDWVYRLKF